MLLGYKPFSFSKCSFICKIMAVRCTLKSFGMHWHPSQDDEFDDRHYQGPFFWAVWTDQLITFLNWWSIMSRVQPSELSSSAPSLFWTISILLQLSILLILKTGLWLIVAKLPVLQSQVICLILSRRKLCWLENYMWTRPPCAISGPGAL